MLCTQANRVVPHGSFQTDAVAVAVPVVADAVPVANVVSQPLRAHSVSANRRNTITRRLSSGLVETNADTGIPDWWKHQSLTNHGFPPGLRAEIIKTLKEFPSRVWVVDNSGSMSESDGNLFVADKKKMLPCTRWIELQHCLKFHLKLAEELHAPCDFQLLNPGYDGEQFLTCSNPNPELFKQEVAKTWKTIKLSFPQYKTPLSWHIQQIHDRVYRESNDLRARGERICVILATDGLPSDNPKGVRGGAREAFRQALNSLHGLPVWVVVRLLTDEDNVVEYWNDLDQQVGCAVVFNAVVHRASNVLVFFVLSAISRAQIWCLCRPTTKITPTLNPTQVELPLEVLDDWSGEAKEVYSVNPWFNYTEYLHHAREMGLRHPVFDLMDEKAFGPTEVRARLQGLLFFLVVYPCRLSL